MDQDSLQKLHLKLFKMPSIFEALFILLLMPAQLDKQG